MTVRLSAVQIVASIVLLSLSVSATFSELSAVAKGEHTPEINEAEEKLGLAFDALNQADEIGGSETEVTRLAEKLNTALNFLTEAKAVQSDGNDSLSREYASRSIATSDAVREEAERLLETTLRVSFSTRVAVLALAPVIGLVAAVVFYLVHQGRRRPSTEKILRMGIGRKE